MKKVTLSITVNKEVISETFEVDNNYSEFDMNAMLKDWLVDRFEANWEEDSE